MRKEIISILILILLLSTITAVMGGGFIQCPDPSTCYQCAYDGCLVHGYNYPCWCHTYCPEKCEGSENSIQCEKDCLKECCKPEALEYCQNQWFIYPYGGKTSWIELNDYSLNGCKVQDLLCSTSKPESFCDQEYCNYLPDEEREKCMTNCENCNISPQRWSLSLSSEEIFRIPVPVSCQNPSLFFQNSECGGSRTYDSYYDDCMQQNGNLEICKNIAIEYACCIDATGCGSNPSRNCIRSCSGASIVGKTCRTQEVVILKIGDIKTSDSIIINGKSYLCNTWQAEEKWWGIMIIWYDDTKPFPIEPVSVGDIYYVKGIPSELTVKLAEGSESIEILAEKKCCYECTDKSIPGSILYPKVDIEQLSIAGGPTVIKDGKVVSSFTLVPGTQQAMIQIENRGFFTQNAASIGFQGLPEGITVEISPSTQKIKSQNIATYSATFTIDPNVPSGTYKVTMIAYSDNGVFDTITIDLVVP